MLRIITVGLVSAVALSASANAGGFKDGPSDPGWTGAYAGVYGGYSFGSSNVTSSTTSNALGWPTAGGLYNAQNFTVNTTNAAVNGGAPYNQSYQTFVYSPSKAAIDSTQSPALSPEGFDVGGTAGYNWQRGRLVFGVEGSFGAFHPNDSATRSTSSVAFTPYPALPQQLTGPAGAAIPLVLNQNYVTSVTTVDADWLATLRGRLGYATGQTLFYGTGGVAFTSINLQQRNVYANGGTILVQATANTVTNPAVSPNFGNENTSVSSTVTGWTAGGGVEMKIGGNWTGKLEYLHLDFGDISTRGTVYSPGGAAVATVNHTADLKNEVIQAGLNYHFFRTYEPLK